MNEVLTADDQELVEALTADRPDPALGDGVGIGRANRCEDDLDTGRAPDTIERPGELRVPDPGQELEGGGTVTQISEEIAGLLGNPRPGRVGGDASQVHPPAAQFDDEQHVQPL
jgi:hypothetical protein